MYIKEIFINNVRKNFGPFWLDSNIEIENDPYTSDCSDPTNATNPHAYTQFTIVNGEMISHICIEKLPGKIRKTAEIISTQKITKYSIIVKYIQHGIHSLNVAKPAAMEKKQEAELALEEYVHVQQLKILSKP